MKTVSRPVLGEDRIEYDLSTKEHLSLLYSYSSMSTWDIFEYFAVLGYPVKCARGLTFNDVRSFSRLPFHPEAVDGDPRES